jgi:oligoendopeptidase F
MPEKNLPERSAADKRFQWRLEDLYPTDGDWEKEFAKADGMIPAVAAWEGKLNESARSLLQALEAIAALSLLAERLYCYAAMRRDGDNGSSLYQGMTDRASGLSVRVESALAFFDPEMLAIARGPGTRRA